jgi:hypothetical protein
MKTTKKIKESFISLSTLNDATTVIRIIDNKFRLEIIDTLNNLKEANVTQIYESLGMRQEVCSIHLKGLRDIGVVKFRRKHKMVFYSLDFENLNKLLEDVFTLGKHLKSEKNK